MVIEKRVFCGLARALHISFCWEMCALIVLLPNLNWEQVLLMWLNWTLHDELKKLSCFVVDS